MTSGAFAARKLRASPLLAGYSRRRLAMPRFGAAERGPANDAGALRLLQREIFAKIFADLSFSSDLIQYPEIADVPAGRPLLVAGFGRTGSTLLHNLLCAGCQCAGAVAVELWTPSPPPRPETYTTDSAHRKSRNIASTRLPKPTSPSSRFTRWVRAHRG